MITEDFVSREIAELLKEKGFHELVRYEYHYYNTVPSFHRHLKDFNGEEYEGLQSQWYSAPTQEMVCKWLREVHKIIISFNASFVNSIEPHFSWNIRINSLTSFTDKAHFEPIYINIESEIFEEACEAAIQYALKNLI